MIDLSGKTALITGASGGIGEAIARALHAQGADVALSGRKKDVLEKLSSELKGHALAASLDDRAAIADLIKAAEQKMGKIDILVNNAGLTKDQLALRLTDEAWDEVIAVDLTASFLLARAVLRGMVKRRWGRIISIASVVATMGNAGQANYAAAKGGLIAMSKSLAREVANRGITVNCVAPGFIETAMTDALSTEQKQALAATIPSGRFGKGTDVASAVAWLASDGAAYVTGQTIHVNGGMVMP